MSTTLETALALHRTGCVADGHADSLMWNRDLNRATGQGHLDFPRLREAGFKLQCFTVVTRGFPFVGGFPLFARWQGWPAAARKGEWARAVWQLDQMAELCRKSEGAVGIVRTLADLEGQLARGALSAVLGIEGAHALEGRVDRVQELWDRGVRFMSLTHLGNNELGGSSFPTLGNKPLSPLGREVLDEMVRVGMAVDVAHASERTLDEILAHAGARPFCSHTGIRSAGGGWRNLSDEVVRTLAQRGGVVGVIYATVYLGGKGVEDVVRHIERGLELMGEDGVALGSDFDGMVPLPRGMRDVRDVIQITQALLQRGHPESRVAKVLGENWRRFLGGVLGP